MREQIQLFTAVGKKVSDLHIAEISYDTAMRVIVDRHYLHRKGPCSIAFGLFDGMALVGVITYGTPSSAPLRGGICGHEYANDVIELTRLWVDDSVAKNGESYLIGNTLKRCGKKIVVSFADSGEGHVGTVYQATNWIYTGLSADRTSWTIDGSQNHGQTIADRHTSSELRALYGDKFSLVKRTRKHRYIYLNTDKRESKQLLRCLRYPVLPYPKLRMEREVA